MNGRVSVAFPTTQWSAHSGVGNRNQSAPVAHATASHTTRARLGDVEAFNQLVLNSQDLAYHIAYRLLHNGEMAADAVQDSLIKPFRGLATYRGGSFKSWLLRILINTCYDQLRQQKRQATTRIDDLSPGSDDARRLTDPTEQPEDFAERMELRYWLEREMAVLPIEQRIVLVLCDVEGYAYEEICAMTGAPMGTVNSRLSRGRVRLRDFLVKHQVLSTQLARRLA